jgi:hypothetical protein
MEASLRVCFKSEFFREERFDSYGGTRSVKRIDRMRKMELQTRIRPVADRFGEQGIDAVFTIMRPRRAPARTRLDHQGQRGAQRAWQ